MKNIFLTPMKKVTLLTTMLLMHWMLTAATYTWTGATSTDWNVGTNWSAGFPGLAALLSTDVLVVPNAGSTLNDPSTLSAGISSAAFTRLTLNGNAIAIVPANLVLNLTDLTNASGVNTGNGSALTIDGTLNVTIRTTAAIVNGGGTLTVTTNGVISITNPTVVNGDGIRNNNSATFTNNGNITMSGATGSGDGIFNTNLSTFDNNSTGTVGIGQIATGIRTNNGATFTNNGGSVTVASSSLNGIRVGVNTGIFTNSNGGQLQVNACRQGISVNDGGTFNNNSGADILIQGTTLLDGINNMNTFINSGAGTTITISNTAMEGIMNNESTGIVATFWNNTDARVTITNAGTSAIVNGTAINLIPQSFLNIDASIFINNAATTGVTNYSFFENSGPNQSGLLNIQGSGVVGFLNQTGVSGQQFKNHQNAQTIICGSPVGFQNATGLAFNGSNALPSGGRMYIGNIAGTGINNLATFNNVDANGVGSTLEIGTANTCGPVQIGLGNSGTFTNSNNSRLLIGTATTNAIVNTGTLTNNAGCGLIQAGTSTINNTGGTITNAAVFTTNAARNASFTGTINNSGMIVDRFNTFNHSTAANTAATGIANTGTIVTKRETCGSSPLSPVVIGDLTTATHTPGANWTATFGNGTFTNTATGGSLAIAKPYIGGYYDYTFDIMDGVTNCGQGTMLLTVNPDVALTLSENNSLGAATGRVDVLTTNPSNLKDTVFYSFCTGGGFLVNSFVDLTGDPNSFLKANIQVNVPTGVTMTVTGVTTYTGPIVVNVAYPSAQFNLFANRNITFANTLGGRLTANATVTSYFDGNLNNVADGGECAATLNIFAEVGQNPTATICKDINVSLNAVTCSATIVPQMIGEGYPCDTDYDVFVIGPDGLQVPGNIVNISHIGTGLKARLINVLNGNFCWANIKVQDKIGPSITCPDNINIYCGQATNIAATGNVLINSDCSPIKSSTWSDVNLSYQCLFPDTIIRTFVVTDIYENISNCQQRISLTKPTLLPSLVYVDHDTLYNCENSDIRPTVTGYPMLRVQLGNVDIDTIELNPTVDPICNIRISYFDSSDTLCSSKTKKVLRTWMIEDRCTPNWVLVNQWIFVLDTTKPTITPERLPTLNVTTSIGTCSAAVTIPPVGAYDNCSEPVYVSASILKITQLGDSLIGGLSSNGGYLNIAIKTGTYTIRYTATDACGNFSSKDRTLIIEDKTQPVAICRSLTTINLVGDSTPPIAATYFNEGSYDCCIDHFEVKRASENDSLFRANIVFTCADQNVMVVMKVWDCSGNFNSCMVNVIVQDKVRPKIIGPPNLAIECSALSSASITESFLNEKFGKIVTGSQSRDTIKVDVYNDGTNSLVAAGIDGIATDNCSIPQLKQTFVSIIDPCGIGSITRTFVVIDNGGFRDSVQQVITINNSNPFYINKNNPLDPNDDVIWPKDTTFTPITCNPNLDPTVTGRPILTEDACDQVLVLYKDEVFKRAPNTLDTIPCFKILRTWTIIDWCQYQGTGNNTGRWEYHQTIKVFDNTTPLITSAPLEGSVVTYGFQNTTCTLDDLLLPQFTATDACVSQSLLEGNKLVTTDFPASSATTNQYLYRNVPAGVYNVRYLVEDDCGNAVFRNFKVLVKDSKKPTPVCRLSTIDIMPTGMVRMDSIHVNNFSNDNCTPMANLKFRLTRTVSNFPDTLSNSIIFNCNDVCNSPVQVLMYVGDESGNWDYCVTTVQVQDNIIPRACDCSTSSSASITGAIKTEVGEDVEEVTVKISTNSNFVTSANGFFQFPNLSKGTNYSVEPEKDLYLMNGVSTADLVAINKHILGLAPFNSPYKSIAADVNKDGKVSTADIVELRKLILYINENLPNGNKSWRFVDKNFTFTTSTPLKESFPEIKAINGLNANTNADFIGIKVGDVNNSASPNSLIGAEDRNGSTISVTVADKSFVKDDIVNLSFNLDEVKQLSGAQFTLNFDPKVFEFVGINMDEPTVFTTEHIGLGLLNKGAITFSWNAAKEIEGNNPIFALRFKAKENGRVSGAITINSRFTPSEAYSLSNENHVVDLRFNGNQSANFVLFQNQPNPFTGQTTIAFNLPMAGAATLSIIDMSGRVVKSFNGNYSKGYNEVLLRSSDLPSSGVYHYQLRSDNNSASRKLIVLE